MTAAPVLRLACRLLIAALFVSSAAGCVDGYPTEDVMALDAMSPADHVKALNRRLAEGGGEAATVALDADCRLSADGTAAAPAMPLAQMGVRFDTDADSGRYLVLVNEAPQQPPRLVFEVKDWVAAVAFRSHLQQLQRLCTTPTAAG